jgi:hypothetical protein
LLGDGALDQGIGFGVFLDAAGLDELAEEVMQFLGIGWAHGGAPHRDVVKTACCASAYDFKRQEA